MGVHVLEVTLSDEELILLEARASVAGLPGPVAYLRERIRHDLGLAEKGEIAPPGPTLDEVFAPFREEVRASGMTEEELDALFDAALKEVRAERRQREKAAAEKENRAVAA